MPEKPQDALTSVRRLIVVHGLCAAALAELTDVVQLLDRLRAAGARIMPEVWHHVTAARYREGKTIPSEDAPSPGGHREKEEYVALKSMARAFA